MSYSCKSILILHEKFTQGRLQGFLISRPGLPIIIILFLRVGRIHNNLILCIFGFLKQSSKMKMNPATTEDGIIKDKSGFCIGDERVGKAIMALSTAVGTSRET